MQIYVLKVFIWYFINNVNTNKRIQRERYKDDSKIDGMGPDRNEEIDRDCWFGEEDNGTC